MLAGAVVLVAGAGPGLGREVAAVCHREGARVMLMARREESLAPIVGELADAERVAACTGDLTDRGSLDAVVAQAVERFGTLTGVVQVAAMDRVLGGIERTSEQDWRSVLEVNVLGTRNVVLATLAELRRARGSIVFIGSQSMLKPPAERLQVAYAASKAAQQAMAYHLAQELGPSGVRVNSVVPSWMWGPLLQGYVEHSAQRYGVGENEITAGLAGKAPLGTIAADEDVAEAVAFLLSDRARAITGQSLLVNAGEYMR